MASMMWSYLNSKKICTTKQSTYECAMEWQDYWRSYWADKNDFFWRITIQYHHKAKDNFPKSLRKIALCCPLMTQLAKCDRKKLVIKEDEKEMHATTCCVSPNYLRLAIWILSCCPYNPNLIFSFYQTTKCVPSCNQTVYFKFYSFS